MKNFSLILASILIIIQATIPHQYALMWGLSLTNLQTTWTVRLTYSFLHVGWLHLSVNLYCLLTLCFLMHAKAWQFLTALAIASTMPAALTGDIPTLGISVLNFALSGMLMVRNRKWLWLLMLNVAFVFITSLFAGVAWLAHLYAMLAGTLVGFILKPQFNE